MGLGWAVWHAPDERAGERLLSGSLVMIAALLSARLAYLASHWQYFRTHPNDILTLPFGGLTWAGALAGGLIAVFLIASFRQEPAALLADALVPLLTALGVAAWLGCWLDGCAYGQPSEAWYRLPGRDEWGNLINRVPVQFMGATLILFTGFLCDRFSRRAGQAATLTLGLLGLQMLLLTDLRADPAPIWQGLRLNSWASLVLTLFGTIWFLNTLRPVAAPRGDG